MSIEKFSDPGLPEHLHRQTDDSEKHARRAERQVAILFLLSAVGTVGTVVSYLFIKPTTFIFLPVIGNTEAQQFCLGLGLAASVLFIGLAAVHWAKQLMPDNEVVAERAGDGRAACEVFADEGLHDLLFEAVFEVEDVVGDVEELGYASGVVDVV